MTQLFVTYRGTTYRAQQDETCTFGRSQGCMIHLDRGDHSIARVAGALIFSDGHWWLRHHDGRPGTNGPPLHLIDDRGNRDLLQDGRVRVVDRDLRIIVQGEYRDHLLDITLAEPVGLPAPVPGDEDEPATQYGTGRFSDDDRWALAALFSEYLDGRTAEPQRLSFADAARMLGDSEAATRRRIERIMERLAKARVPGMSGPSRLEALRQHVIPRVVGPDDLTLLLARLRDEAHGGSSQPDQ